jgi:hypothetical protein
VLGSIMLILLIIWILNAHFEEENT